MKIWRTASAGVIIQLQLPSGDGLKAGSTPMLYQGLEVGQLTKLTLNPDGSVDR
ncbi:Uncharacterised protein [Kluyvera cryocrescens]|uniref:Mce/MlaD domain-containing protein n=1 Tax=Kluyvera cryocrescens TaxID=580 RepID=A0A485A7J1_KLUCR|nr:Uncharacterised protein [Kluyvera cryocrescens]